MDPTAPFLVRGGLRRLELGIGPPGRNLLVDELYLRQAEVLILLASNSTKRSNCSQADSDEQVHAKNGGL